MGGGILSKMSNVLSALVGLSMRLWFLTVSLQKETTGSIVITYYNKTVLGFFKHKACLIEISFCISIIYTSILVLHKLSLTACNI